MSNVLEESLLSESLSLEDLHHEGEEIDDYISKGNQKEKFGIVNMQNEVLDKDIDFVAKVDEKSVKTIVGDLKPISEQNNLQTSNVILSPNLKPFVQSNFHSAEVITKYHHSSSSSTSDENKEISVNITEEVETKEPKTIQESKQNSSFSPVYLDESIAANNWVVFDEKFVSQTVVDSPIPTGLTRKPPEIPLRKILSSSNQPPSNVNTLFDLPSKPSLVGDVPPIPERILSPTLLLSKCTPSHHQSTNIDIRLPPPPSGQGSFKRQTRSRNSLPLPHLFEPRKTTSILAPPVPPRKDIFIKQGERDSFSDVSKTSDTSSQAWIKFELGGSSQDELLESISQCTNATTPSQIFGDADGFGSSVSSLNASSALCETINNPKNGEVHETQTWMSSTPPGSPKTNKKKKKGYHHLSSGSEEESKSGIADEVTIEVTDLSPVKPLSQWSRMQNEEKSLSDSNSVYDSFNDPHDDLELDADDAFALNLDRLSTDGSALKGFNRADKGSQNNLVDFSESAEHLEHSSGVEDRSSESELETVFDMTASGDSLKRRRRRRKKPSITDRSPLSGSAAVLHGTSPKAERLMSLEIKPNQGQSTNPFWRHSPLGDSISLTSSTSETNPFDRVQFLSNLAKKTPPALSATIPTLPPPPKSGKQRSFSGNVSRPRPQADSFSQSMTPSESGNDADDVRGRASAASSLFESRQAAATPVRPDSATLLDLIEHPSSAGPSDTASAPSGVDSPTKVKVSCTETASSKMEPSILETTVQILDGFSPPQSRQSGTLNVGSADLNELSASDLSQNRLNSYEEIEKAVSVESPQDLGPNNSAIKKLRVLNKESMIPTKTEWSMLMRLPRQKRALSSRKWVPVFVRLKSDNVEHPTLELLHSPNHDSPFFFVPLYTHDFQLSYPTLRPRFVSRDEAFLEAENSAKNRAGEQRPGRVEFYSAFKRKVHCVKVFQTHYKERRSFVSKKDRFMTRAPAGFKHSVKRKEILKLGTEKYDDLLSLLLAISDASFQANRLVKQTDLDERKPIVKFHSRDEIMIEVRDEFMGELSANGNIEACDVTVHVFVTSFLSGDPLATITFNEKKVQGKEVVRRNDIIPSSNNFWIDMQDIEVHCCSSPGFDEEKAAITFYPPDACRFELARFHCPYSQEELPIIVRPSVQIHNSLLTLRCALRSNPSHNANDDPLYLIPCEDLAIRFPLPESWAPAFRRREIGSYKSVRSRRLLKRGSRRGGLLGGEGIVRELAGIEASVGDGKYEVAYGAIVWRVKRFPEKNAAYDMPQVFTCVLQLESEEHLPSGGALDNYLACQVEFSMPSCSASNCCVRSLSLPNCSRAEKFTRYTARYLYSVRISASEESAEKQSSCSVQ